MNPNKRLIDSINRLLNAFTQPGDTQADARPLLTPYKDFEFLRYSERRLSITTLSNAEAVRALDKLAKKPDTPFIASTPEASCIRYLEREGYGAMARFLRERGELYHEGGSAISFDVSNVHRHDDWLLVGYDADTAGGPLMRPHDSAVYAYHSKIGGETNGLLVPTLVHWALLLNAMYDFADDYRALRGQRRT